MKLKMAGAKIPKVEKKGKRKRQEKWTRGKERRNRSALRRPDYNADPN
jgi:tRNA G37 N-methylase TrmD